MTPEDQQQFHDINRPGHTGPTPTSRPVIVGHRPAMPDPMVNHRPVHHQPQAPVVHTPEPSRGGPSIDGFMPPPTHHHATEPSPQPMPDNSQVLAGEPLQSPPFVPTSQHPHHQSTTHHQATILPEADPLFHGHHDAGEHSQITHAGLASKRTKMWAPLIVLILLIIAMYLAIDSGLIGNGIKLPFHLFPQATPPIYTPYFK